MLSQSVSMENGRLNPTWVVWLMNWPLGWTSLEPMKSENWEYWKESSATYIQSNGMREMWFDRDPSTPSQGQESAEQYAKQRRDSVPNLPHSGAYDGRNMGIGESGPGDLQSLQLNVSAGQNETCFDMQQRMPIGMGADQRCKTMGYTPRVITGLIARADRLTAIGNGQVPRVAATAWEMLS